MFSKVWLINLILLCCAAFFGIEAYGVWSRDLGSLLQIKPGATRKEAGKGSAGKGGPGKKLLPESAFSVVVTKNLFAPERKEVKPDPAKAKPKPKAPQAPKDNPLEEKRIEAALKAIVVYGVVLADDYRAALVTDVKKPAPPPKKKSTRGRRRPAAKPPARVGQKGKGVKWVRVGDEIGDFKVAGIMKDRIVLKKGAKSYERPVYDRDKPKPRAAAVAKAGPTVISTGSAARPVARKMPPKRVTRTSTPSNQARLRSKEEARRAAIERLKRTRARKK